MIICSHQPFFSINSSFENCRWIGRQFFCNMNYKVVLFNSISNCNSFISGNYITCITCLTTRFCIKWCFIKYKLVTLFPFYFYCSVFCYKYFIFSFFITCEFSSFNILDNCPVSSFNRCIFTRSFFLILHLIFKSFKIEMHIIFFKNKLSKINRKSKSVIHFKCNFPGKYIFIVLF